MPKLVEPPHAKTHWDYMLDEVAWMATDFHQERKWKRNCSRKLSLAIHKHFKDKEASAELAAREHAKRLRKQAATVARDIMAFWRGVERIVEYKQRAVLDEKRKSAMDAHLNFIVDQTEKYSSWLIQSLSAPAPAATTQPTMTTTTTTTATTTPSLLCELYKKPQDDDEYRPGKGVENEDDEEEEDDDETTIEREERKSRRQRRRAGRGGADDVDDEIRQLQMESELPFDELLRDYNLNDVYFTSKSSAAKEDNSDEEEEEEDEESESASGSDQEEEEEESEEEEKVEEEDDEEFSSGDLDSDDELDDEETLEEEERLQRTDAQRQEEEEDELAMLRADSEMPVEEALASLQAAAAAANKKQEPEKDKVAEIPEPSTTTTETVTVTETETTEDKALSSIAATAQSLQPTGYTLETTHVKTPVPSQLLKHALREYQHVGLDWLVTMYENKLNGILADEMGLGKTIQTIALLAHLAVERCTWGPHLIVVPTSVMLNWELEFKKWCPGFKILTYYGSPKERRLKRQGWTKANAFHVCITSYKLVIQVRLLLSFYGKNNEKTPTFL